jgi:hypothetical protein
LSDFIPPALLRRRPDFRYSAVLAAKGAILVVTALDELRDAIASRGPQQGGRDRHRTDGAIHRPGVGAASLALSALETPGLDVLAALFGAFHLDSKACVRS